MHPYVNLNGFGESMIKRFHYSMTPYSAIERRDGEPVWDVFDKQRKPAQIVPVFSRFSGVYSFDTQTNYTRSKSGNLMKAHV